MPKHIQRENISMEPFLQDASVTSLADFSPGVLGPSDSSVFEQIADYDVELPNITTNETEDLNLSSGPYPPDLTRIDLEKTSSPGSLFKKPFNIRPTRRPRSSLFYEDVKDSEPDTPEPKVHLPFQRRPKVPINPDMFNFDSSNDSLNHSNSVSNFVTRRRTRTKKIVRDNIFDSDLNSSESDSLSVEPPFQRRKMKCKSKTLDSAMFNEVFDITLNRSLSDCSESQQLPFKKFKNRQTDVGPNGFDSILDSTDPSENSLNHVSVEEDYEKEQSQLKNEHFEIHPKDSMLVLEKSSSVNKNKDIEEENETCITGTVNNESRTLVNIIKEKNALDPTEETVKEIEVLEINIETKLIETRSSPLNKEEDIETCRINYQSEDENTLIDTQITDQSSDSELDKSEENLDTTLSNRSGEDKEVYNSELPNNNNTTNIELDPLITDTLPGSTSNEVFKNSRINLNESYTTKEIDHQTLQETTPLENCKNVSVQSEKITNELLIMRNVVENETQNTLSCDASPTDCNGENYSIDHHNSETNNKNYTVSTNIETSNRCMNVIKITEINTSNDIETLRNERTSLCAYSLNTETIFMEAPGKTQPISCTPNEKGRRVSFKLRNDNMADMNQEIVGTPNEKGRRVSFKLRNDNMVDMNQEIVGTPNEKGRRVSFKLRNDNMADMNQEIVGTPNEKGRRGSFKLRNDNMADMNQEIVGTPNVKERRVSFRLGNDKLMVAAINQEIVGTPNVNERRVSFRLGNDKTRKSIRQSSIDNIGIVSRYSTSTINQSQNNKSGFSLDSLVLKTSSGDMALDSMLIDLHPSGIKSTSSISNVESNISQFRTPNETTITNRSDISSRSEDSGEDLEESVYTGNGQSTVEREISFKDNVEEEEEEESIHKGEIEDESNSEYGATGEVTVAEEEDSVSMGSERAGTSRNMLEEKETQEYNSDFDLIDELTEQNENLSSNLNVNLKKTHDTLVSNSSVNFKKPHTLPLDTPNSKQGKARSNYVLKKPLPVPLSKRKVQEILDKIPISELKSKKKKSCVPNLSKEQSLQHEVEEALKKRQSHKPLFSKQSTGKLKKPKKWVSPKLYEFIISKLGSEFGIKSRVRAEKLVLFLVEHVECVLKKEKNYFDTVEEMKIELANLKVVETHWDFYLFVTKYFDGDFVQKVYPLLGDQDNNPYEPDPFENIL